MIEAAWIAEIAENDDLATRIFPTLFLTPPP
jgi:hypothetical protein